MFSSHNFIIYMVSGLCPGRQAPLGPGFNWIPGLWPAALCSHVLSLLVSVSVRSSGVGRTQGTELPEVLPRGIWQLDMHKAQHAVVCALFA